MYSFETDDENRALVVKVVGTWTLAEIERYRDEAIILWPEVRRNFGCLRLLIDNLHMQVIPQSLTGPLNSVGRELRRPGDRVALLVGSSLLKIQTRRLMPPEYQNIFVSRAAAMVWLTAHGCEPLASGQAA